MTHLSSSTDTSGRIAIFQSARILLTCKRVEKVEDYHYNPGPWIIPAPFNGFTQKSEPNGQICTGYLF